MIPPKFGEWLADQMKQDADQQTQARKWREELAAEKKRQDDPRRNRAKGGGKGRDDGPH